MIEAEHDTPCPPRWCRCDAPGVDSQMMRAFASGDYRRIGVQVRRGPWTTRGVREVMVFVKLDHAQVGVFCRMIVTIAIQSQQLWCRTMPIVEEEVLQC
jgi:hypothetical protein